MSAIKFVQPWSTPMVAGATHVETRVQRVEVICNASRWEATVIEPHATQPLVRLDRLVEGKSTLRGGDRVLIDLRVEISQWAGERNYRHLAVNGQWF